MQFLLMNRTTPVAAIDYDTELNVMTKFHEWYNLDYAPLAVKIAAEDGTASELRVLNNWFKGRGIPSHRKGLTKLLEQLGVESTDELLNKAYALSFSDQYWIKEYDSPVAWKDINFFDNDFQYEGYLQASLSSSKESSTERPDLHSPNNTIDGMLPKGWIIENGKRVLVKGSYEASREEPINEWLASAFCRRMGFEYCPYRIAISGGRLVSKCDLFVAADEEMITANDIFVSEKKKGNISDIQHYINILEKHNVPNARRNVENMILLDAVLMNTDRHLRNFGVIRNVETLEWKRTAPIFDTGEAMNCGQLTKDIHFSDGKGKLFRNTNKSFSTYLAAIPDLSRFDTTALNGLVEEYHRILVKYQPYTESSSERIEKLVRGLSVRLAYLESEIRKSVQKNQRPSVRHKLEALQAKQDAKPTGQTAQTVNKNDKVQE
ncbi:MAG: HipA domain-containing protein [Eubacterium sp.]|nr:HipA domain-containing protein [Eubacterium sp.]